MLLQVSPTEGRLLLEILCADFTTLQGSPVCLKLEKSGVKAEEKFISEMGGGRVVALLNPTANSFVLSALMWRLLSLH